MNNILMIKAKLTKFNISKLHNLRKFIKNHPKRDSNPRSFSILLILPLQPLSNVDLPTLKIYYKGRSVFLKSIGH